MLVLGIGIAYNYLSNIYGARSSLLGHKTNHFLNLHVALEYNHNCYKIHNPTQHDPMIP